MVFLRERICQLTLTGRGLSLSLGRGNYREASRGSTHLDADTAKATQTEK